MFTRAVDDQIYAQPLVKLQINMPGKGVKNVVYVATVNNSVYAFDADSANEQAAFWQVSLTAPSARPVNKADMTGACGGFYNDFSGNMGIVGTPVIDTTTNTLYVVARSLKQVRIPTINTCTRWILPQERKKPTARCLSPQL